MAFHASVAPSRAATTSTVTEDSRLTTATAGGSAVAARSPEPRPGVLLGGALEEPLEGLARAPLPRLRRRGDHAADAGGRERRPAPAGEALEVGDRGGGARRV